MAALLLLVALFLLPETGAQSTVDFRSVDVVHIIPGLTYIGPLPSLSTGIAANDIFAYEFDVRPDTAVAVGAWKISLSFDGQRIVNNGAGGLTTVGGGSDGLTLQFRALVNLNCVLDNSCTTPVTSDWSTSNVGTLDQDDDFYPVMPDQTIAMPTGFTSGTVYIVMKVVAADMLRMIPPSMVLKMPFDPEAYEWGVAYNNNLLFQSLERIKVKTDGMPESDWSVSALNYGIFPWNEFSIMIFPLWQLLGQPQLLGLAQTIPTSVEIEISVTDVVSNAKMSLPMFMCIPADGADIDNLFPLGERAACACYTTATVRYVAPDETFIRGSLTCDTELLMQPKLYLAAITDSEGHQQPWVSTHFNPIVVDSPGNSASLRVIRRSLALIAQQTPTSTPTTTPTTTATSTPTTTPTTTATSTPTTTATTTLPDLARYIEFRSIDAFHIVPPDYSDALPALSTAMYTGAYFAYHFIVRPETAAAAGSWKIALSFDGQRVTNGDEFGFAVLGGLGYDPLTLQFWTLTDLDCAIAGNCARPTVTWTTPNVVALENDDDDYESMPDQNITMPAGFTAGDVFVVMRVIDAGIRRMVPPSLILKMPLNDMTHEWVLVSNTTVAFNTLNRITVVSATGPPTNWSASASNFGEFALDTDEAMAFPLQQLVGGSAAPLAFPTTAEIIIRVVISTTTTKMTLPLLMCMQTANYAVADMFPLGSPYAGCACHTFATVRYTAPYVVTIRGNLSCDRTLLLRPTLYLAAISSDLEHSLEMAVPYFRNPIEVNSPGSGATIRLVRHALQSIEDTTALSTSDITASPTVPDAGTTPDTSESTAAGTSTDTLEPVLEPAKLGGDAARLGLTVGVTVVAVVIAGAIAAAFVGVYRHTGYVRLH